MEEISKKLDNLLSKAGQENRYQYIIVILFLFQFLCSNFLNSSLLYLQSTPYVIINHEKTSQKLNYTICELKNITYEIDTSKKVSSLIIDYNIYCDKTKVSLIEISLFSGMIIGGSIMYLFADRIGRKIALLFFFLFYILLLFIFFFIKSSFILTLLILFFIGIITNIIILTMIIYICEIIKLKNIPIFLTLILIGFPISSIFNDILFELFKENWRYIILIIFTYNILIYITLFFYIIGSPIFAFMNNDIKLFKQHLNKIALKNKVKLEDDDFNFLEPYMDPLNPKKQLKKIESNEDEKVSSLLYYDKESFFSYENEENSKDELIETNEEVDNVASIKFFFAKYKLKDYSLLDLFKKTIQISNFSVMSYLWIVSELTIEGINFENEKFKLFKEKIIVNITIHILEIIFFFIIIYLLSSRYFGIQKTLISLQLISFIIISISLLVQDNNEIFSRIILFYLFKICWSGTFLIINIMSTQIYPTVIRSKGLGLNNSFGKLGNMISPFLFNNLKLNDIILYFLVFTFFSLLFTYVLPKKIGSITLDYVNDEVKNKNKNTKNIENDDSDEDDDDNYDVKYRKKFMKSKRNSLINQNDNIDTSNNQVTLRDNSGKISTLSDKNINNDNNMKEKDDSF